MTTLIRSNYTSILATSNHKPVTSITEFGRWTQPTMGFFLTKGMKDIGHGDLMRCDYVQNQKFMQTESVRLEKAFRRKGHGIQLYVSLIETARKLGAERIYSSTLLNKFSRRMWSEKLPRVYNVHPVITRKACDSCSSKHPRVKGYYIELK